MDLNSYEFHYDFWGNRDNPLIIFLHGFLGDSHEFDDVIPLLSDQFCSLTIDLPGHGKTRVLGGEEYYTMPATAQALIYLLDQLKVETCALVGYSMGGRLALYLSLHFAQRFSKVVLESTSPGLKNRRDRAERIQRDFQLARKLEESDFSEFLLQWYDQPIFDSLREHSRFSDLLKIRSQNNPWELAKSLRNLSTGGQPSLWKKLEQNENPWLLLVGEYDAKFIEINSEMAKLCPSAKLELVSHCGHNIHFENPKLFASNVKNFLM